MSQFPSEGRDISKRITLFSFPPLQNNQTIQVAQQFMEYEVNSDEDQGPISDNCVYFQQSMKSALGDCGMGDRQGELVTRSGNTLQ